MTYLQYLTTFIQLFIIITFSYLIFNSNNEKIQENFGRRSKTKCLRSSGKILSEFNSKKITRFFNS